MPKIGLHDHTNKEQPTYCTLMKEICHSGWTKSMGEVKTPDDATIRPRCHKWVSVFVNDPQSNQIKEVFDCNEQWGTDMQQQIAQEVYQNAAATEQVRNNIVGQSSALRRFNRLVVMMAKGIQRQFHLNGGTAPSLPNGKEGRHGK